MENSLIQSLELIVQSEEKFPVDFDEAWQWVGYSLKENALRTLKANFEEGMDFDSALNRNQTKNLNIVNKDENQVFHGGARAGAGRKKKIYFLTTDCFKSFCMLAQTEKGKEVRAYYIRIEKEYQKMRRQGAGSALGELNAARGRGDLSRDEFRRLAFGLGPLDAKMAHRQPGTPPEERIREADAFIKQHFEMTGYRPDWIKAIDVYRHYKQTTGKPIPKLDFSRRMYDAGAIQARHYDIEIFAGVKYREK